MAIPIMNRLRKLIRGKGGSVDRVSNIDKGLTALEKLDSGGSDDVLASLVRRDIKEFTFTSDMGSSVQIGNACPLSFNGLGLLEHINGLEIIKVIHTNGLTGTPKLTETLTFQNVESVGDFYNGGSAFGGSGVRALSFPSAEQFYIGCFVGAPNLETIYAPQIKTIGTNIFDGTGKVLHVYIGSGATTIHNNAFSGSQSGMIIDCGFAEGAVSDAPWGATNATINYNVPDPGSIDAMIEADNGGA